MSFGHPAHTSSAEHATEPKTQFGWRYRLRAAANIVLCVRRAADVLLPIIALSSCNPGCVPRRWLRVAGRLYCCLLLYDVLNAAF